VNQPCPYCAYDLAGLADVGRCPECGNIVKAGYLESLMRHRILREEQTLYWIAVAGWSVHMLVFGLLVMVGSVIGLIGFVLAVGLMVLTLSLMGRSRRSWPRRFAATRGGIEGAAPRGTFFAILSWTLPAILVCGILASL